MALIVRNISGSLVLVNDLGLSFAIGEDYDLAQDPTHEVRQSSDLESRLNAGELVFLDPLNGSTQLNTVDSIELFDHIAAPNYRIFGGDLNQLDDVEFVGIPTNEDFLVHDGIFWRERSVAEVNSILGSSPGTVSNFAAVVLGQTVDIVIQTAFADVLWPVIHLENDVTIVERDDTNTQRILIKDTGTYDLRFNISFDADAGEETIEVRMLVNDSLLIPGSFRRASEDDEINDLSNAFIAELTAGEFVTLQIRATGTGNLLENSSNICVIRVGGTNGSDGAPGPAGPTGSGSNLIVRDEGIVVPGGPHSEINFTGATVDATDAGGGIVNVNVSAIPNIFGSESQNQEDLISFSTNSTTFQQVMRMTTPLLPTGTYRIGWSYNWNYDNKKRNFNGRVQIDNTIDIMEHVQEPKDSGTDERIPTAGFAYTSLNGVHDIDFDISCTNNGDNATVRNVRLELWRIS